jgi:HK97 family phage major capsid protein
MGLLKRGYANGAVFAMNNKTLYNSVYSLTDSNKRPLFVIDTQNDKIGKLLGVEVVVDDNIGDNEIYYGNFRYLGYNLVDGIAVEASSQSSFKSGRIDYRGMAIADIQVLVPEAFVKIAKPTT